MAVELFLLRYVIGPENWRHSLNQSDLKPTLRTGHLRFPMLHPRDMNLIKFLKNLPTKTN